MDIKSMLVDILENDIWEINHDYGKIKRTAIVKLSKIVEHISEDVALTNAIPADGQSDAAEIWTNEDESAEIERQIVEDACR